MSQLGLAGHAADQTWPYFAAVAAIAGHLSHQVWTLDINDPDDCGEKFRSNRKVGLVLFLGVVAGTAIKAEDIHSESSDSERTKVK